MYVGASYAVLGTILGRLGPSWASRRTDIEKHSAAIGPSQTTCRKNVDFLLKNILYSIGRPWVDVICYRFSVFSLDILFFVENLSNFICFYIFDYRYEFEKSIICTEGSKRSTHLC